MIAESIVAAASAMGGFKVPVVVRLQGTNSDIGLKLVGDLRMFYEMTFTDFKQLEDSGLGNLTVEADFEQAAGKVVELSGV